ncbi:AEC family transporter [Alphaproteobacteria bacterium]|nr:AEC family transporter [Alphaproteobacteria bacterium]
MWNSLGVIAPVIAILATGFFTTRFGVFSAEQIRTLNRFVFMVAAPALLFRNVAITQIPERTPWELFLSYYGAMLACLVISLAIGFLVFSNRSKPALVIIAFGSCFSNTVMLGIPIILTAFGEAASLPLFLILAFHGLLVFSVSITLLEFSSNPKASWRDIIPQLARSMAGQQVILALLAGVIWNFTGLGLAPPVDRFLALLGQSAIPLALVAVGGLLAHTAIRSAFSAALYISLFKLVIMPALVFALAHYVFALPPLWTATITLLAAMPTGVFTSVFAVRYEVAEDEASSAIVLSSVLGIFTIILWLSAFSHLVVPQ